MSTNYAAALDLSGREAGFAVLDGGKVVLSLVRPMRGRDSAQLAAWVKEELRKAGIALESIRRWTVGSGPGSFTGMRLAAALVNGWTYGKAVETRCVPTAAALAANLDAAEGERIGALCDGRNRELIFFELEIRNGEAVPTGVEKVLNAEQAKACFADYAGKRLTAFESELPALEKLLEPEVAARITAFPSIRPEALALASWKPFDNNLADLVYIRPAVFTAPIA